jgi:ElaB/YqjD/DUF883 family membrane-anchored ribosome-binding protein
MIHSGNGKSSVSPQTGFKRLPTIRRIKTTGTVRHQMESWIVEHPVASIAAALTLGAALGWLIKRR